MSALPAPPCWPRAADPEAAQRLIERFAGQSEEAAGLAASAAGGAMLAAAGGGSPHLSDLLVREHAVACRAAAVGFDAAWHEVMAGLAETGRGRRGVRSRRRSAGPSGGRRC